MKVNRIFVMPQIKRFFFLTTLILGTVVGELGGQDRATVRVEENVRAEPQGAIIGRLSPGTSLPVLRTDGRWVEVELQGWIWTSSLQMDERPGFDLRVSAVPHENLRAEPNGAPLGVMLQGALLENLEEVPGWTRVRRVAWVWGPSLDLGSGEVQAPPPRDEPERVVEREEEGWWRSGADGAPILTGPDGDTLARARPGTELQLLARQGNWIRVRLEGWSWAPSGPETDPEERDIISSVTPEEVSQNPDEYRGVVVSWELQFISREEAERVRTDFYEGEPFLLARATSSGRAFVYVAVPPERLIEVEGLIPLERIRVVGRIRTGAAAFTGNPILDLLELTRDLSPG
jgi:hypothetical protein